MSRSAIHGALSGHLATYATAAGLSVAWANRTFQPTRDMYLREALIPARTVQASLGDEGANKESGIYQVDVVSVAGQGFGPASAIVDAIIAHFSRGLRLPASGGIFEVVVEVAWSGPVLIEDGRERVPISIPYYAYT